MASMLIAVPAPYGGVIVLARESVAYVDTTPSAAATSRRAAAVVESLAIAPLAPCAWTRIDATRYLVADEGGGFFLLELLVGSGLLEADEARRDAAPAAAAAAAASSTPSALAAVCRVHADGSSGGAGGAGGSSARRGIVGLAWHALGTTVQAATLAYTASGLVFVGSRFGDSRLLRLLPDGAAPSAPPSAPAVYFETVTAYSNLGPIVDMCAVDLDRQGQCQVVTASGTGADGSLRVVRKGIGIEEQAVVDLPGITGLWSLRPASSAAHDKYIVQSYAASTRVLALESDEEMAEVELAPGFDLGAPTLVAANMRGDALLQVTPAGARLVDAASAALLATWAPEGPLAGRRVTVAAADSDRVLLALAGGTLVLLSWHPASGGAPPRLEIAASRQLSHEVSCLDMSPLAPEPAPEPAGAAAAAAASMEVDSASTPAAAAAAPARFAAAGLWSDASVRLLRLDGKAPLTEAGAVTLGGDMQARSALLATLEGAHYLFAAQGDGTLLYFRLAHAEGSGGGGGGGGLVARERKRVTLGTQPVTLSLFRSKGALHIFAACDRPTVLYSSSRKVVLSNVNQGHVNYMAPFHSAALPDCVALASADALTLGTVDDIQKLHVRAVPLGEAPRKVVHLRDARAVAVAVEAPPLPGAGAAGAGACAVRLFDDAVFARVASFALEPDEIVLSLLALRAPAPQAAGPGDGAAPAQELLIVGTAYNVTGEEVPSRGRIVVLAPLGGGGGDGGELAASSASPPPPPSQQMAADGGPPCGFALVAQREVRGGVFALAALPGGKLVACINSKVQVYAWGDAAAPKGDEPAPAAGAPVAAARHLVPECAYSGGVLSMFLTTRGDFLLVGDLMNSVKLLHYDATERRLDELAAEGSCQWMTALAVVDDATFIGAEHQYNIFSAERKFLGAPEDAQSYLEIVGEFHLGDMVNRFVPGSLVMLPAGDDASSATAAAASAVATASASAEPLAGSASPAKRRRRDDAEEGGEAAAASAGGAAGARPRFIFGTVGGGIGCLVSLPPQLYRFLATLQRALSSPALLPSVGGLSHGAWRSWLTDRRTPNTAAVGGAEPSARRFIDGDLIELFLDLDRATQDRVAAAMNELKHAGGAVAADVDQPALHPDGSAGSDANVDEILKTVEELSRMH